MEAVAAHDAETVAMTNSRSDLIMRAYNNRVLTASRHPYLDPVSNICNETCTHNPWCFISF